MCSMLTDTYVNMEHMKNAKDNLKHDQMLDPLGQAWQSSSAFAVYRHGRTGVNKYRLCGPLL